MSVPKLASFPSRVARQAALAAGMTLAVAAPWRTPLAAQSVGVDPHAVVLSHVARSGGITLLNPSGSPVEFTISTVYGFAGTDSLGNPTVFFPDTTAGDNSAVGWVEPYPRRLRIAPNGSQDVRFRASPPPGLPPGEYWARVIIHSTASAGGGTVADIVDAAGASSRDAGSGVSAVLKMEMNTVIPLFYRNGDVATGVRIRTVFAERKRAEPGSGAVDSLVVIGEVERLGNAAFLGTATITLLDPAGREVAGLTRPHAVYRETTPRYAIPIPAGLPMGGYTVRYRLEARRNDVPHHVVLPADAAERRTSITLP